MQSGTSGAGTAGSEALAAAGSPGPSAGAPGAGTAGCGAAGAAGSATCDTPLDEATLTGLSLMPMMTHVHQLRPGDAIEFTYFLLECCYFETPISTCTEWSVTPTEGANWDPSHGSLDIHWDTPGGTVYTVTGDVENGRHVESIDVYVVTQPTHPIIGRWSEAGRYDCATGAEGPADPNPILEISFYADGYFEVTWIPFEVRIDYWGTYVIDLDAGTIDLTMENGNHLPDDADLSGTFRIDSSGDLILGDFWFGSDYGATTPPACGHRLTGGFQWE